eukprot:10930603-Alexandrium_andersonii.AAC.1
MAVAWEEGKRSAKPQACTERGRRFRPAAARCVVCKRSAADCSCEPAAAAEPGQASSPRGHATGGRAGRPG